MQKIISKLIPTFLFVAFAVQMQAQAALSTLSIQGILKKTDGTALDNGQYDLTFKLYTVLAGGTAIWTEIQTGVKVGGGIYSTALGSVTPFNLPFDVPYFLGVTYAGEEITPRTALSAAPYALALLGTAPAYYGDIKTSFAPTDHAGWVRLDGRAKTALTATQQVRATALGIGANLPNDDNLGLVGTSGTKSLGTTGGSATVNIGQTHLPSVYFNGSTGTAGSHNHTVNMVYHTQTGDGFNGGRIQLTDRASQTVTNPSEIQVNSAGDHSHSVSVHSGGSGTALNVENPYLAVHYYMYLGL